MNYSLEEIYCFVGKDDKPAGLIYKNKSEAFENSFSDFYYFYPKKNKFSYQKNYKGETFFDNKDECLKDLYEDRIRYQ